MHMEDDLKDISASVDIEFVASNCVMGGNASAMIMCYRSLWRGRKLLFVGL